MFRAMLTLENADQADFVTVSPDEAIVTINDTDGRQSLCCILGKCRTLWGERKQAIHKLRHWTVITGL